MPVKRRLVKARKELDPGQRAFLAGDTEPPKDCGVFAFNRWCWLCPPWVYGNKPEDDLSDGSPGPRELWRTYGREVVAEWDLRHPGVPHPLITWLGVP